MGDQLRAIQPLTMLIVKGGFLLALAFGAIGIILVYLGSTGYTEISVFGQSLKSENVGISALFLSAVMIVILIRKVLATVNNVAAGESKSESPDIPEELLKKHKGNKVAAIHEMQKNKKAK